MIAPDWPLYARRGVEMARLMRWSSVLWSCSHSRQARSRTTSSYCADRKVRTATFPKWSGFYFGVQTSFSQCSADFSSATASLIVTACAD